MLVKMGVYYNRLRPKISQTMDIIDDIFVELTGQEAVLTSTNEGNHLVRSHHYRDNATDYRLRHLNIALRDDIRLEVKRRLRDKFGDKKYDICFSNNDTTLHVEYDPK